MIVWGSAENSAICGLGELGMTTKRLFDPLKFLKGELRCAVELNSEGRPVLVFDRGHSPKEVQQARAALARYERLLTMQIQLGGLSIQKLIAKGVIRLNGGRYELGCQA